MEAQKNLAYLFILAPTSRVSDFAATASVICTVAMTKIAPGRVNK